MFSENSKTQINENINLWSRVISIVNEKASRKKITKAKNIKFNQTNINHTFYCIELEVEFCILLI